MTSLKHVIIHKIDREANTTPSYNERNSVLDVNASLVTKLIEEILDAYTRGKSYGSFDPDTVNYPVQTWLKDYLALQEDGDNSQIETSFVGFTKNLLKRIGNKMTDTTFATGGYFIFAEYSINFHKYLLVAMVKDKSGLTVTSNLEIKDVTEIDLDKLHQAAQINIDSFLVGEESYLSFLKIKDQGRDFLRYFTEALGCKDYIESKVSTDNAMKIVEKVCQEANLDHSKIREVRDNVYEYLKGNVGQSVSLTMIAAQMNGFIDDEQYHNMFVDLANSDQYRISTEFTPNAMALRKYKKIYIKSGRWSLNFEKELLGPENGDSKIVWDGEILSFRNISETDKEKLNKILAENQ